MTVFGDIQEAANTGIGRVANSDFARILGEIGGSLGPAPRTGAATTHALELRFGAVLIGACFNWTFNEDQTVEEQREIHVNARGRVRDLVKQTHTGTLDVTRFDLFKTPWGRLFTGPEGEEIVQLSELAYGLRLYEVWKTPYGLVRGSARYEYSPVKFTRLGRPMGADNDRIIRAQASARVGRRRLVAK